MAVIPYFGTYTRFETTENVQGAVLMGADSLIGDELSFEIEAHDGGEQVWLTNRFGARIGKLGQDGVGHILLCRAKQWSIHVLLASVYASSQEDSPRFWGEVVIIAFPEREAESFQAFAGGVAEMLAEGVRPQVDLQQSSLEQIVQTGGSWRPSGRVRPLDVEGSALAKGHRSFSENMIEEARKRNPGCMAVGIGFIVVLLAGAVWLVLHLLGGVGL